MFSRMYAFPADVAAPADGGELDPSLEFWNVRDSLGYDIAPSALTETEGILYVPTDKGNLVGMDAKTGSFLWAHKISVALVNPVRVLKLHGRRCVLASTMDGTVVLLEIAE